jgi:DNA-binding transcriptional regulator LsrR (DeoR family)
VSYSGFVKTGLFTPGDLISLKDEGAVGDVGGQIYTLAGTLHPSPYNQRVIGLTLRELMQIPVTIAVATGQGQGNLGWAAHGCHHRVLHR